MERSSRLIVSLIDSLLVSVGVSLYIVPLFSISVFFWGTVSPLVLWW